MQDFSLSITQIVYFLFGVVVGTIVMRLAPDLASMISGTITFGLLLFVYFKYYRPYRRSKRKHGE